MKVILEKTQEVIEVTKNEAHGLIDSGKAKLFTYVNRQIKPKKRRGKKGYRTK